MKINIKTILCVFLVMTVLSACNSKSSTQIASGGGNNNDSAEEITSSIKNNEEEQDGNEGILTKPGQTFKEEGYTVELIKIIELNETVDIPPLQITLNEAKLLKYKDMTQEVKERMRQFTNGDIGEEFTYLQLTYTTENTEDINVGWFGLSTVVTDQKEQIDVLANDFIADEAEDSLIFYGQVIKESVIGIIFTKPGVKNIKLVFEKTLDYDATELLSEGEIVEFSFD